MFFAGFFLIYSNISRDDKQLQQQNQQICKVIGCRKYLATFYFIDDVWDKNCIIINH